MRSSRDTSAINEFISMIVEFKNTLNQSTQIQNNHQFYWLFLYFTNPNDPKKFAPKRIHEQPYSLTQYDLWKLQSMNNTQQTCNRCHQKASQIYYCHDVEDGICYPCSKIKDRCSVCNKKSNVPVNNSSRIIKSRIQQICNICEKSLQCQDKIIDTECKHSLCIACVVKKIRIQVKKYKKDFGNSKEGSILGIKCNCLLSKTIKIQQFLNKHCFCCGQSLENDKYQQLLLGIKISRKCKATISPRTSEKDYNEDKINYNDIKKLLNTEEKEQFYYQNKKQKQSKQQSQKVEHQTDRNSIKSNENKKYPSKFESASHSQKYSSNKQIEKDQIDGLSCVSCGKTLDKYSLLLIEDSFHLCYDCQRKSKSYVFPKQKIAQKTSYNQKSIERGMNKSPTKEKETEKKKRIFFQGDLFQQRQPLQQQNHENSKNYQQKKHESICVSCNESFNSTKSRKIQIQSQLSDKICHRCIEINYSIIEKQQDRCQKQVNNHKFFPKKSRKDMSYSQYLKQIIILQSPQMISENLQPSLQRKPSQQTKDRRAIYSVVQEFPQFQQLQIIGYQDQLAYCYNCKLFLCKTNLFDCSNMLKKKSLACKMCYLMLYSK